MPYATGEFGRIAGLRDQFEIGDALADADAQLVAVDHSGKGLAPLLPVVGFGKKVFIAGEADEGRADRTRDGLIICVCSSWREVASW